ncbi:MAG: hypothetical protein P1S46_02930 [bacterium]|nr:hypothetical protein [bacterium]MDT8396649.1 hypothetical protein [bacterium]
MNLKKILVAAAVIYAVVSLWRIGTPYIKNAMFSNDIDTIARTLSVDGTVEKARLQVLESARLNEIPVTEGKFTIVKDEQTRQVLIEVKYTVQVKTPFELYTHTWNFSPRAEKGLQKLPSVPNR